MSVTTAPAVTASLTLTAFNLLPGAAFLTPLAQTRFASAYDAAPGLRLPVGVRFVAVEVTRDPDAEVVTVLARRLDGGTVPPIGGVYFTFRLGYCSDVDVFGLVVNADDPSDDDFGA